jgi:hypothetical protein
LNSSIGVFVDPDTEVVTSAAGATLDTIIDLVLSDTLGATDIDGRLVILEGGFNFPAITGILLVVVDVDVEGAVAPTLPGSDTLGLLSMMIYEYRLIFKQSDRFYKPLEL